VMPSQTVLAMATCDGARALLWEDEIGSLEPGKRADLIVINPDTVTMLPLHDPVSSLVSSLRSDNVASVMVNGKWVMWERRVLTVNEEEIIAEGKQRAAAVARRAGIILPDRFPVVDKAD
jgi:5-methylthioadenosine/S-adenosylhomocysteine deaminase